MALIRKYFSSGASAGFAAEVGTALEALDVFDEVTVSSTTVTCTNDSDTVLVLLFGATDYQAVIEFYNSDGVKVLNKGFVDSTGGSSLARGASYSTDGNFVYIIVTNSSSSTGGVATRAMYIYIGKTKDGSIGVIYTARTSGTAYDIYPQNTFAVATTSVIEADTSVALAARRSASAPYLNSYEITAALPDGSIDTFESVHAILFSPDIGAISFTAFGLLPTALTIGDKKYITDGVLLIEYDDTEEA